MERKINDELMQLLEQEEFEVFLQIRISAINHI